MVTKTNGKKDVKIVKKDVKKKKKVGTQQAPKKGKTYGDPVVLLS